MLYDKIDLEIIKLLQKEIPLESRPYLRLAEQLGISEAEIVRRIKVMKDKGVIRRFGATLNHRKAGFTINAMVGWKVDLSIADQAGSIMASFNEVSHCYLRDVPKEFGYSMFTMIHTYSEEKLGEIIQKISNGTGIDDFKVIRTIKELKKTSMVYY
ncbi:MAG: AsnC family transcriptional regulator [Syntrophomonadaceae bacterium]|nr:AsnC family transcriptional regulator [Syntrophomonadaceae bacterium]MDD3888464.1 AsnC family transcriptional regulator [Syntrophomonadaceae bacterium]MDD4549217.1 AsnC family transcriptional regulator [Syntrophomonadaceae bacterium]